MYSQDVVSSLISGVLGVGGGATVVYWVAKAAFKNLINEIVEAQLKPVWEAHDKAKEDTKKEYARKDVCKVIHEHSDKQFERIESKLDKLLEQRGI